MLYFLKIVGLNVLADWRRNIVSVSTVAIGTVVLLLFGGFVESMYDGLRENTIHSQLGHIQIMADDQQDTDQLTISPDTTREVMGLVGAEAGVELVSQRLQVSGLASSENATVPVNVIGVEPDADAVISSTVTVTAGSSLFDFDQSAGLLGTTLLEELGVDIGDVITLLSTTNSGAINAVDIKIVGAIDTGITEINRRLIKTNVELMQELVYSDGVTQIVVMADATANVPALADRLRQLLSGSPEPLRVAPWYELSEEYHQVVDLFDGIFTVVQALVWLNVVVTLANSFLLAVYTRTRQFATFRAIGGSSRSSFFQILCEGVLITALGVGLGVLIAYGCAALLVYAGVPMPTPPGSSVTYPIRIILLPLFVVQVVLLMLGAAVLSLLLPAYRASRVEIGQAMKSEV